MTHRHDKPDCGAVVVLRRAISADFSRCDSSAFLSILPLLPRPSIRMRCWGARVSLLYHAPWRWRDDSAAFTHNSRSGGGCCKRQVGPVLLRLGLQNPTKCGPALR